MNEQEFLNILRDLLARVRDAERSLTQSYNTIIQTAERVARIVDKYERKEATRPSLRDMSTEEFLNLVDERIKLNKRLEG